MGRAVREISHVRGAEAACRRTDLNAFADIEADILSGRDAYEFDPEAYDGQSGGLPGMLRRYMRQQSPNQPGADFGLNPANTPDYSPETPFSPQASLLGRMIAQHMEQSRYQPGQTGGASVTPRDPNFRQLSRVPTETVPPRANSTAPENDVRVPMAQSQYEADQAQQAREAAATQAARAVKSINRSQAVSAPSDLANLVHGTLRAFTNGVPIVGAFNNRINAALDASLAPVLNPEFEPDNRLSEAAWSDRYGHALQVQNNIDAKFEKQHPLANKLAAAAGSMALFGPLKQTSLGAKMLGLTDGPIGEMMLRGGTTRAAIGGLDAAARGMTNGGHLLLQAAAGAAGPVLRRASDAFNILRNLHRIP